MGPKFYNDRVCLNVLAGGYENAKAIYDAVDGHVVIGVLSKNYMSVEDAVKDMQVYDKEINGAVSVGLGAGDPKQCYMVNDILAHYKPAHVNQVFSAVNGARTNVANKTSYINALVSPSGTPGFVVVSTGPLSCEQNKAVVEVDTAISMIKEMGGDSIKFYPMNGLDTIEEYKLVASACAKNDLGLEPTGGIDMDNFEAILKIAIDAGVKKIIPHVYTSIIDKDTKNTNISDVMQLFDIIKKYA